MFKKDSFYSGNLGRRVFVRLLIAIYLSMLVILIPSISTFADNTLPTILSTNPQDGATNVPLQLSATVEFSEPMNQQSVKACSIELTDVTEGITYPSFTIQDAIDVGFAEVNFNPAGDELTLTTDFELVPNHIYRIRLVGNNATDLAGNPLSEENTTFSFTTATAGDVYVEAMGNDATGNGSQGNPWKTITHALSQVTGTASIPTIIHVTAGTYSSTATGRRFRCH